MTLAQRKGKGNPRIEDALRRGHTLVESEGIMTAHKKTDPHAQKTEHEVRTVKQPRKPGQGTPQNPPVGRTQHEEKA